MTKQSIVHSHIAGRNIAPISAFDSKQYPSLSKIGINLSDRNVANMFSQFQNNGGVAMDAITPTVTSPSAAVPIQFLESWLPGFVYVLTQARKIDELVGITTIGNWEDEEIVQGVLELTGVALPYGDWTNVPFASWNPNYERRTIVRGEQGLHVGPLESARAAVMNIDNAAAKRQAAALSLEIFRNNIGFYGFNGGANRTYGFLNDPSLPAYVTVPVGASGSTTWANKTFLEIVRDIRSAISALRTQMGDNFDPATAGLTLAVASNAVDWLTTTSDFGISVGNWIQQTFPRLRVVSAPQLNGANGGQNVFYLYPDEVIDGVSTDGGRVFIQAVPAKFQPLGIQPLSKGFEEDYTNATAGVMVVRPYAVVRRSGI